MPLPITELPVPPLDNTSDVETPERIRFRYHVAGPSRRALAWLVDALVRGGVLLTLGVFSSLAGTSVSGVSRGAGFLALFLVEWGYYVAFETLSNGRSVGKRALGLRVVKQGGYPIGFVDCCLRNLLRAADFLPLGYVLGVISMVSDGSFRRLGDRVAGAMVIIEDGDVVLSPLILQPPATAAERAALPHRIGLSADERDAIDLFLRRQSLTQGRRVELAAMVAPVFAQRMGLPAPTDPVRWLGLLMERTRGPGRASDLRDAE